MSDSTLMQHHLAFVFPGQGSQSVGMLSDLMDEPIVRQTFIEASDAIATDLIALALTGPDDTLNLTRNTQPVMLAADIALYRFWCNNFPLRPQLLAGHSLGEYAALVAAEAIDWADAIRLVRYRAECMQNAVPPGHGAMAAVLGLEDTIVVQACAEISKANGAAPVEAVNFNAPGQIVIAGHKDSVSQACDCLKSLGAMRCVLLPVSAPFHSSLMLPVSVQLKEYLTQVTIRTPVIQFFNNADVALETEPYRIKDALCRQAYSPVRWTQTVLKMLKYHISYLVECGPGKVLTALNKRITRDVKVGAVYDRQSVINLQSQLHIL